MHIGVLLLRGINVGGRNLLPMSELKTLMEAQGAEGVETYIQSGNAVFLTRGAVDSLWAQHLADAVENAKGFRPDVFVLAESRLQETIRQNPFPEASGKALVCYFLDAEPKAPDLGKLQTLSLPSESFRIMNTTFYLHAPEGTGRSKLAAGAERALGVSATARNWNTVTKLAAMAEALRQSTPESS